MDRESLIQSGLTPEQRKELKELRERCERMDAALARLTAALDDGREDWDALHDAAILLGRGSRTVQ